MLKKYSVIFLKKLDLGSAVAMRFVKITGKDQNRTHPKHLIGQKVWFSKFLKKNDEVLDIGCNSGQTAIKISKKTKKVTGFDIDQKLIDIAKEKATLKNTKNTNFFVADANKKFPFKSNKFDKVICSDVLEHINKRDSALFEITRVLKKKGYLFLVTDNPDTSWKNLQKSVNLPYYADPDHKYEYPKDEIIKKLKNKNFKIISISTVTYDTPLKGLIDLTGGFSLSIYKKLRKWRQEMVKKHPEDTTGYKIIAQKT